MRGSIRVEPAELQHSDGLELLFSGNAGGCYCRYWQFTGDKNDWQARYFQDPAANALEMRTSLAARTADMRGFVALADTQVIGWLKLSPAQLMGKLYDNRPYRSLPCFADNRSTVHTIGCVLVAAEWRRRGVARALLTAAVQWSREQGISAIEAFPRRGEHLRPADLWQGPLELFLGAGFVEVSSLTPYPVLRLNLDPALTPPEMLTDLKT